MPESQVLELDVWVNAHNEWIVMHKGSIEGLRCYIIKLKLDSIGSGVNCKEQENTILYTFRPITLSQHKRAWWIMCFSTEKIQNFWFSSSFLTSPFLCLLLSCLHFVCDWSSAIMVEIMSERALWIKNKPKTNCMMMSLPATTSHVKMLTFLVSAPALYIGWPSHAPS